MLDAILHMIIRSRQFLQRRNMPSTRNRSELTTT